MATGGFSLFDREIPPQIRRLSSALRVRTTADFIPCNGPCAREWFVSPS
jgi:hypothetical protein